MTLKIAHIRQASLKTPAAKKSVYEIETELERVDHELAQAQQKYQRASSSSAMEEPEEQQEQENRKILLSQTVQKVRGGRLDLREQEETW
jgi:chromosome condensin MukBEF ATPase and DNA-binding subunit MukB